MTSNVTCCPGAPLAVPTSIESGNLKSGVGVLVGVLVKVDAGVRVAVAVGVVLANGPVGVCVGVALRVPVLVGGATELVGVGGTVGVKRTQPRPVQTAPATGKQPPQPKPVS